MKRCPSCQKTYDDAQGFCSVDATPLVGEASLYGPQKTMAPTAQPPANQRRPRANNSFYVSDPDVSFNDLRAALQERYPNYKISFLTTGKLSHKHAANNYKGHAYIKVQKSFFTGAKVFLGLDNKVSVRFELGNEWVTEIFDIFWFIDILGYLIGKLLGLFGDGKFPYEVRDYLNERFGETEHLPCGRCNSIHPHYLTSCPQYEAAS